MPLASPACTATFGGRPLAKHDSRGKSLSFSYDQAGNILTKTTYQGSTTRYQYNAANRLVQLVNPDYLQVNYQYDPAGRMLSRIMSSGARSSYQYDANGRLLHQAQHDAHGALIADTLYTRDRLGHVLTQTDLGAPTTYAYDALYRLTSADYPDTTFDEAFTYDKVGNRLTSVTDGVTTRRYSYTAGTNRLGNVTRVGTDTMVLESSFVYDDEGRLTKQNGKIGVKTLTWDAKGRLKTLKPGYTGPTETYTYDPQDQRIGRSGGPLGSLDYHLEGEHLESVYQSGTLKEKYPRGASIDELVAGYLTDADGKLKPYLYHQDPLTSTTQVSGHNGGTLQGLTYGAFGNVQASTGSSPNRLKYTGREDDGTGLIYYRARYYDPRIGRFISEDPMGFGAGDVNFYAYVGNDPVNNNDPSGLILPAIAALMESAPAWGPVLLGAGRAAIAAATSYVRTNPGMVAGSISGAGGLGGYYSTTKNPTALGAGVATGIAAAQGVTAVYAPGAGSLWQGALIGGGGDALSQSINLTLANKPISSNLNLGELAGATITGGVVNKFFGESAAKLGSSWSEQAAGATMATPFTTAFTAIGQKLGEPSKSPVMTYPSPLFTSSPGTSFNDLKDGVMQYPSRSNTNQLSSVYGKPSR